MADELWLRPSQSLMDKETWDAMNPGNMFLKFLNH
jgi:hypothetical protein